MKKIKEIYKDLDKPLLFVTICLFIFGLFNIVTASSNEAVERYGVSIYYYFIKQLLILILGFIISLFIFNISSKKYKLIFTFLFLGISSLLTFIWFF